MTTITIGTNTYNLIPFPPSYPGISEVEMAMSDTVATVVSPYVPSQIQTQSWPGADAWGMTLTTPKMSQQQAGPWRGFLAELRGVQNIFQFGDPFSTAPRGVATGTPVVAGTNLVSATVLNSIGWTASVTGILLAGDYIQLGYHLHQVCEDTNSNGSGVAAIPIWPSLREVPTGGSALILNNTVGVWRLAQNQRSWHSDFTRLVTLSLKCTEVR